MRDVLVVEDNPAEARLIREALAEAPAPPSVRVAKNHAQALGMLSSSMPNLILLDLNLPGRGGHQLLAAVRTTPRLASIPVVIFSSSTDEADIRRAYAGHANCYVAKPGSLDDYFRVLREVERFWLATVELPECKNRP